MRETSDVRVMFENDGEADGDADDDPPVRRVVSEIAKQERNGRCAHDRGKGHETEEQQHDREDENGARDDDGIESEKRSGRSRHSFAAAKAQPHGKHVGDHRDEAGECNPHLPRLPRLRPRFERPAGTRNDPACECNRGVAFRDRAEMPGLHTPYARQ